MPRILIVDDMTTMRMLAKAMLAREGFELDEAKDGEQALQRCEETRPDLVLLDMLMPGIDGLECLRRLRAGPLKDVKVVIMTTHEEEANLERAREAGCDGHVWKPLDRAALVETVRRVLGGT